MRLHERTAVVKHAPAHAWRILGRGRYRFGYDQMPMEIDGMSLRKRLNLARAGANIIHRRARPWSMPLHMQFELTNYCNLRCPVCPTGARALARKPQAMEPELFERVYDEVGPYLLTASLWAWGEPNLHPRLGEMLRIARRYPVATMLSTNGQNLNDDRVLQAIFDFPPTYLIVAIDGLTDETNSQFRVGARLAPALEGVRRLAEMKAERGRDLPVLHMRFIAMKHNEHEMPALEAFASDHGFDLLTIRTLSTVDVEDVTSVHRDLLPMDPEYRAYEYDGPQRVERDDFYCLNPFWFPTLYADGSVVGCEQDPRADLPMGVVSETRSFRDTWYGDVARAARRQLRDRGQDFSFCRTCPLRDREGTDVSIEARFIRPVDYGRVVHSGSGNGASAARGR